MTPPDLSARLPAGSLTLSTAAIALAAALSTTGTAATPDARAAAEIDYLLDRVGSSACVFIRGGDASDGRGAREHLERKYRFGRSRISSADEFIRNSPDFEAIPADYLQARGAHLYWSPTPAEDPDLVGRLRAANPRLCLAWEPSWLWEGSPPGALAAAAALVDLVTPDDEMAKQMTGAPEGRSGDGDMESLPEGGNVR